MFSNEILITMVLFFNFYPKNFISSMSWLELILEQSLLALWNEVMLLRKVWMMVIWLFKLFSFDSETSHRTARRWLSSITLYSFSFISCRIKLISLKLSIIISSFTRYRESGSVFVKNFLEGMSFQLPG